jgi:hypothetical protein
LNPWLDKKNLRPGENWRIAIRRAIRESRFFIVLISSSILKRRFIHREIKEALDILDEFIETDIFIIPVRLDDCDIPYEKLKGIQYVDLFPKEMRSQRVKEIIQMMKDKFDK